MSRYLLRDYGLRVNTKKVYRLCHEEGLLLSRPKKKRRKEESMERFVSTGGSTDQINYGNLT